MKSDAVLRDIFKKHGAKKIADGLGLSPSFIYKWCQADGGKASGGLNPLERVAALTRVTGDRRAVEWVCAQADGYFVPNPDVKASSPPDLLSSHAEVVHGFAVMLELIAAAVADKAVSPEEAAAIRTRWEGLKSLTEDFVNRCEQGSFQSLQTATVWKDSVRASWTSLSSVLLALQWWFQDGWAGMSTSA